MWHSLVDPGGDPGPTHIHGITAEMLAGAPCFTVVAPKVAELVAGRVLVAHNAGFDWGFLQAQSLRCVIGLESSHRLCTLALVRRLDLDVRDFKLGTLRTGEVLGRNRPPIKVKGPDSKTRVRAFD